MPIKIEVPKGTVEYCVACMIVTAIGDLLAWGNKNDTPVVMEAKCHLCNHKPAAIDVNAKGGENNTTKEKT